MVLQVNTAVVLSLHTCQLPCQLHSDFFQLSWFDCTLFILHNPTSDAATSAMERLKGKVAIVTGGGNGIGAAICQRLNAEGARVLVADVDIDAAKRVSAKLKSCIPWQACRQRSCTFFGSLKDFFQSLA